MSLMSLRPISTYLRNLKINYSQKLLTQASRRDVLIFRFLQKPFMKPLVMCRNFSSSPICCSNETNQDDIEAEENAEEEEEFDSEKDFIDKYLDPKDRSRVIPPEISIKYMESVAFSTAYGNDPVWKKYRRNYPVNFIPSSLTLTLTSVAGIPTSSKDPRDLHQTGEDHHG